MISVQAETIARTNKIAVKGLMNALQSLLKRDSFLPWVTLLSPWSSRSCSTWFVCQAFLRSAQGANTFFLEFSAANFSLSLTDRGEPCLLRFLF